MVPTFTFSKKNAMCMHPIHFIFSKDRFSDTIFQGNKGILALQDNHMYLFHEE
jgi:hypothetical protein